VKSPVGTALVLPRRKAEQDMLGRDTQAVLLTKSDLEKLMHLRLGDACKQLGLSVTAVKKVCRALGIHTWNDSSFQEHCDDGSSVEIHGSSLESASSRKSFFDNTQTFAWPAHAQSNEQPSCMASGSGVASDSGLGIITTSTATAQERADNSTSTSASSSSTVDGGSGDDPSEALHLPSPSTVDGGSGADPSEAPHPTSSTPNPEPERGRDRANNASSG